MANRVMRWAIQNEIRIIEMILVATFIGVIVFLDWYYIGW